MKKNRLLRKDWIYSASISEIYGISVWKEKILKLTYFATIVSKRLKEQSYKSIIILVVMTQIMVCYCPCVKTSSTRRCLPIRRNFCLISLLSMMLCVKLFMICIIELIAFGIR